MAIKVTSKDCVCDKCGAEGHSIPGTYHRRCTGQAHSGEGSVSLRPKHDNLELAHRGKWG